MFPEEVLKFFPLSDENFHLISEIFDAIPCQIVVKSVREETFGEFLIWNRAAEMNLGITAGEAIGRRDFELFPSEQAESFAEKDREIVRSGVAQVIPREAIMSRTLGLRRLRTTKTPIYDDSGQAIAIMAVSEDITDRESTKLELQRALDFLNAINSQLPGAVYQFRVDAAGRATFPYLSEGIRALTGDEAQEMMDGQVNLLSRILPEDLPGFLANVARSRRELSHCRQEFRLRTRNGDIRWLLSNSLPKHQRDGSTIWHGFMSDVTSARQTSEALRRGEERLHSALSATRAAVWEIDMADQTLYLSPEWGHIFGFGPDEFPRTFSEWLSKVHPDDVEMVGRLKTMRAEDEVGQMEFRHVCGQGSYLWVLLRGKPIMDEHGELLRQVGTVVDVTDRHLTKMQLIEAKETAERASQAKGDFLAMMSHEIRTPLNAVLGFSELLGAMPLGKEQADYVRTIQENSSALLVILNDVLDYSKIESGRLDLNPGPQDIVRLVRSAGDFFRPQAQHKGIDLQVLASPDVPETLLADAARLNQVLHNLISNAVKFTEKGGVVIEVTVEGPPQDGIWPIAIHVRDTGIGIALERHPNLFDPFYQADNSTRRRFGGTGLGLAIVKRLATLMNGTIEVQSVAGKGSLFTLRLPMPAPAREDDAALEGDQKRLSVNLSALLPKILVVEDNATNRRLVRLFLKKLGHDAEEAENGYDGVEKAASKRYDLILMDLEMPGMDGYEATRLIREAQNGFSPFIVALTAHALPEHRERSLRSGMDSYLSKPVKLADLKSVLREALKR
jgi:two-component system sensor histidine kinase/response regulator